MSPATPPSTTALTIAHATDLRETESLAFVHGVALARASRSRLFSVHANDDPSLFERIPRAVDLLTRWKALPEGAAEGDEAQLGMQHERLLDNCCDDPVDTLLRAIRMREPQLFVGCTSGREGLARAMLGSVAEALALQLAAPSLLFPLGSRGFVDPATGTLGLRRILIAAGDAAATSVGAEHAIWLADVAGATELEIELLHVEDGQPTPTVALPRRAGANIRFTSTKGSLEEAILRQADVSGADVLVMATRGHDSLRDVLLGSHAERVLRRSPCPVLSVPLR